MSFWCFREKRIDRLVIAIAKNVLIKNIEICLDTYEMGSIQGRIENQ